MNPPLLFERVPGPLSYREGYLRQLQIRETLENTQAPGTVLLLEHTPVITLGRKANPKNLLLPPAHIEELGIRVEHADRGGDMTYHGPGQLVAYPIISLNHWKPSVGWYLRTLEQVLIDLLDTYGLQGERTEGYTGVWVNGAKVAAIGVGIHHWVTFHGIALNVDPNMEHWKYIIPCGIADKPVTSLKLLLGAAPEMDEVMDRFEDCFRFRFSNSNRPSS